LDTLKGPEDDDLVFAEDIVHVWEDLSLTERKELTTFALELFGDRGVKCSWRSLVSIRHRLNRTQYSALQKITPFITSVTIRPQQFAISDIRFGRGEAIQEAQEAFVQWCDFLKDSFPTCTSIETLRNRSDTKKREPTGGSRPEGVRYDPYRGRACDLGVISTTL
jgi:hypothetical protein